jgi:ABC-2 type transport system ATP-binding protein
VCERVAIIDRGRIVADGTPDQLRSRMVGNTRLQVELRGADGDGREALLALPGVTGVEDRGSCSYVVEHAPGSDPREAIFRLAAARGWVLSTMTATHASLEDVFVRLTTREEPPAAEEV